MPALPKATVLDLFTQADITADLNQRLAEHTERNLRRNNIVPIWRCLRIGRLTIRWYWKAR